MRLPATLIAAALVCGAAPAAAQTVKIEFNNGRVNLAAENAPLRTILSEWARRGGTSIVNGDRVTGAPVTLELTSVPEQQAIEILLRGVAGYMIGWRESGPEVPTSSAFDRLMILPTSTVVRTATPPPTPPAAAPVPAPIGGLPPAQFRQPREDGPDGVDADTESGIGRANAAARVRDQVGRPDPVPVDDPEIETVPTPFGGVPTTQRPGVIAPAAPRRPNAQPNP